MKKQIKVIFLCVSMILATTVTAFAESSEEERNIGIAEKYENVVVTEVAVEENETGITSLRVEDYPNGDVLSVLKRGNEIISSSYLDRERQQVITRDHETGETNVVTILQTDSMYSPQAANETYAYVKVGNIHYKVTKKIEGETITLTPTLGVERSLDSGTTLRDANGKYKNKAELISILAGVLSIPGGVASKVANKILEKIGLAADAVNFLIPTFNVKAAYTMATWHGIGSSKTKVVQGTIYTLYYPDGSMDKETVGDYYNQNSFKNKNTSLALKLGKLNYVGFTTYAVTKWK